MFTGIDHVVIVVEELKSAIANYSRAGFTAVRGGRHPIALSPRSCKAPASGSPDRTERCCSSIGTRDGRLG
jgi:Glyoxalase-like domain